MRVEGDVVVGVVADGEGACAEGLGEGDGVWGREGYVPEPTLGPEISGW